MKSSVSVSTLQDGLLTVFLGQMRTLCLGEVSTLLLLQLVCGTVGFRAAQSSCHLSVSLPCAILVLFLHNLSLDLGSSSFLSQPLRESDELDPQVSSSVEGTVNSLSLHLKFHFLS